MIVEKTIKTPKKSRYFLKNSNIVLFWYKNTKMRFVLIQITQSYCRAIPLKNNTRN